MSLPDSDDSDADDSDVDDCELGELEDTLLDEEQYI